MINEKTLEILKEMKADPKAKELFEGMETPASPDEMVAAYAQVAEKLGYGITAENIREVVELEEARMKANTDKVVSDMEALEDDDLEHVAGGYDVYEICGDAYVKLYEKYQDLKDRCWINDSCDNVINNICENTIC